MASLTSRFHLAVFAMAGVSTFFSGPAWAKRTPPREVAPVLYQNVNYVAVQFGLDLGYDQNGGIIEAQDPVTHAKLWALEIYDVVYDPNLEGDVQDVFISAMTLKGNSLIVENERGAIYQVDLTLPSNSSKSILQLNGANNTDKSAPTATGCSFAHTPLRVTGVPFVLILRLLALHRPRKSSPS